MNDVRRVSPWIYGMECFPLFFLQNKSPATSKPGGATPNGSAAAAKPAATSAVSTATTAAAAGVKEEKKEDGKDAKAEEKKEENKETEAKTPTPAGWERKGDGLWNE